MDFIANDWKAIQRILLRLLKADSEGMLIEQEAPMLDSLVAAMDQINPDWIVDTAKEEEELKAFLDTTSDEPDFDLDDEDNDEDGW